jgi:predicted ATPase
MNIQPSFHCLKLEIVQDTVQQPAATAIQQSSTTELPSIENRELKFLDRIYGRDEEQNIILQTYHQTIHQKPANPSVLIIQGEEGIGKTFLVEQTLSQRVRLHDHGFYVHWKLQNVSLSPNLETVSPDDGFVDAFTSLTNQILAAEESILHEIQDNFSREMNENDRLVLAEMIPCIIPILGPFNPTATKSSHVQASGRQIQIFIRMFRIIAKPERPIVFFMDNIHHADACNLRLLEFLLQDTEIQGIFLVLSLGPVQSDDVHKFVSSLENQTNLTRTAVCIHLLSLDATTTHRMVADILQIDLETSATLHDSLQSRIRGNPRCLYSLMRWMYLNQYLQWEKTTNTWHWNVHHLLDCQDHETTVRTSWSQLPGLLQKLLQGT